MSEDESPRSDPHSAPGGLLPWQKKPRFSWTFAYEATFFQSLCQSVRLGLRENQSFKQEAWNRALTALREQGAYPTKPHLINKTDNARKKFRLWRGLVENPQFTYNPVTKTITGSEEAWQTHLEKEPLARAFRERPFDHAEYLEILFPDVVGSRGHPKRVTRPRRKGPESLPESEPMLSSGIVRLPNSAAAPAHISQAIIPPPVTPTPVPVPVPSNGKVRQQVAASGAPGAHMRSSQNAAINSATGAVTSIIEPPKPGAARQLSGVTRSGNSVSTSSLTPPEEASAMGQQQKRFAGAADSVQAASKRRRTESSISAASNNGTGHGSAHRNRSESHAGTFANMGAGNTSAPVSAVSAVPAISTGSIGSAGVGIGGPVLRTGGNQAADGALTGLRPVQGGGLSMAASRVDGIAGMLSDVLTKYASATSLASTTRWPEQAFELFFHEFADEDMDLQLRIAEKILTDTSKAVMFCKMPSALRKHWVKRLREVSSRVGN